MRLDVLSFLLSLFTPVNVIIIFSVLCIGIVFIVTYVLRKCIQSRKKSNDTGRLKIAFFHPYCNAGGGGEKVLWVAVQALQKRYPNVDIYIYTCDVEAATGNIANILNKVRNNLNVSIDDNVEILYLHRGTWIEPQTYPYFTLLGQSFGSVVLGMEALWKLPPDIFIDTTGFAFTMPIFKFLGGSKTACYVHYPTITTDMCKRVSSRVAIYNNNRAIARSPILTVGKLLYYKIFAFFYSWTSDCSDCTIVNSTFTQEHLRKMWHHHIHLVYPPCDIDHLKSIEHEEKEKIRILSLAQFRPEKNHSLQLQALYQLREIISEELFSRVTLVLCGSCRNQDDKDLVEDLRDLSKHLSLENNVEFKVNISYKELLEELGKAQMGIHTMTDEHFGIAVVELMAAGLITIGNKSGGPLLDIIDVWDSSRLGFLATTAEEYAQTIEFILNLSDKEISEIRERARASVDRFSSEKFEIDFLRAIEPIVT